VTQVKIRLADAMETSLIMLYGLAMDARAEPTILGDTMAAQAFEKVDYDFTRLATRTVTRDNIRVSVAARAKHFDIWTAEFLAAHERATVLHLGAGLDPRVWRVDPGPEVRWYDIDYPGVVEARRKLFPERENYELIPSSVTDPEWLDRIPTDRPVLVVAQGLTMYLQPAEGLALFRRITDRFPSGSVALDTHNRLGVRGVNRTLTRVFGAPLLHWAIDDPRELERAVPRLRFVETISSMSPALVDELPPGAAPWGSKFVGQIAQLIPPLRTLSMMSRFEFGTDPA
jgi:O-methyltransferase involved in polyketide biosynthesis